MNPIALYCVSGVFRQHFNRYLCCIKPTGQRMSRRSRSQALETSFNSTCRRHTQDTHIGSYRSPRLMTSDSVVVTTFEGTGNKQNNSSYLLKNMNIGSNLNKDGCYLTASGVGANKSIIRQLLNLVIQLGSWLQAIGYRVEVDQEIIMQTFLNDLKNCCEQ